MNGKSVVKAGLHPVVLHLPVVGQIREAVNFCIFPANIFGQVRPVLPVICTLQQIDQFILNRAKGNAGRWAFLHLDYLRGIISYLVQIMVPGKGLPPVFPVGHVPVEISPMGLRKMSFERLLHFLLQLRMVPRGDFLGCIGFQIV